MDEGVYGEMKKEAESLAPQLVAWRRDFHRHPEIAFQEERTSRVLKDFLEGQGLSVSSFAGTGLRADMEGKKGGRTVALRADMDALPLQEEGDREYKSENPGAMHACGHDGHMAILMGVVKLLGARRSLFRGRVSFLFQPSEERFPGGAKKMIDEGVLEGVDGVFGLHLWQALPTGKVGIVKGPMMAQPDIFTIAVKGKGGHGSMPQQTVDPILVASHIVVACQSIVSRSVDPLKPAVVSFGTIQGGTIDNIIPSTVNLTGTVRTFDSTLQNLIEKRLREIVEETCRAFGASADISYIRGYPPLVNDAREVDFVLEVVRRILGPEAVGSIDPVMGGEDFAYYLQKVPGAFLFFGAGDGTSFPHHHPRYDLDEKALPHAALLLSAIALEYLHRA